VRNGTVGRRHRKGDGRSIFRPAPSGLGLRDRAHAVVYGYETGL